MVAKILFFCFIACASSQLSVIVTGATGRTGSILYKILKASSIVKETRALVRSVDSARKYLNCSKCDASEGIFMGDVTNISSLQEAFQGVSTVAIAIGAPGNSTKEQQKAIDYEGVINQVRSLASLNRGVNQVVMISSGGTTIINPPPFMGGTDLFYKLNAEAFLGSSGVDTVIVKPCGLSTAEGGKTTLVTGHDDKLNVTAFAIARADVAAVMAQAIFDRSKSLRFDLCAQPGPPTDPKVVLLNAKYPWQN